MAKTLRSEGAPVFEVPNKRNNTLWFQDPGELFERTFEVRAPMKSLYTVKDFRPLEVVPAASQYEYLSYYDYVGPSIGNVRTVERPVSH